MTALQTSILSKVDSSEIDRLETDIQKKASAENLAVTDAKVAGHETEIQKLKTAAEGHATKESVETLKTSLGDKASNSSVSELGTKVDGLEERVQRLGQQSGDATEIAKSIQRLEASDLALGNKIDNNIVEINKRATKDELGELVKKVTANETALACKASKETTDDLTGKVQTLQTAVAGKAESSALQTVSGKVSTIEEELPKKAAASEVSSLKTKVEGLETSIGSKAESSTVTPLVQKVSDLETSIGSKAAASDLTDLNAKVGRIESALPNKVDAVTGKGLSANDLTDELLGKINAAASTTYVDGKLGGILKADGTVSMTGPFNAGGQKIINVADSYEMGHAVNNKVDAYTSTPQGYDNVQCIIPQAPIRSAYTVTASRVQHTARFTTDGDTPNYAYMNMAFYPTAGVRT